MNTQELTFQYWQDGEGTWQWQLSVHERLSGTSDSGSAGRGSNRVVATGSPCGSEEAALEEIALVKGSTAAEVVRASPADFPAPVGDT